MSPANAEHADSGGVEAPRLLEAATRLKEVRRRYVVDSGDGEQFAVTEEHLDSIISDLDGWLKPGGKPVDIGDLDLRLAVLQEKIESVGFPGHARVIASVRENISKPSEDATADEEPPPPQRFEPPPPEVADGLTSEYSVDEWEVRAELERMQRRRGRSMWSTVIIGVMAIAAIFILSRGDSRHDFEDRIDQGPNGEQSLPEPTAPPVPNPIPNLVDVDADDDFDAESLAQIAREIDLAYGALRSRDIDVALQHFAAAATIDRHDARVSVLAGHVLDALLVEADEAFDNGEWELAADRLEVARRIARGLYFDPSPIDEIAQKHADMTRFEDITPEKPGGFRRAVGHAVRVTHTSGEVIFGRLESFEKNTLVLEVQSGFEGGGAEFSKEIPLDMVRELRVFEAERLSDIVLGE